MKQVTLIIFTVLVSTHCFAQKLIYSHVSPGEEIMVKGNSMNLSGSLLLPKHAQADKVPLLVFINGSGDVSYRSNFSPLAEYTFCKDLADLFLARGYAIFFLEKRGINHAGGNWRKSGFREYASDVSGVIEYLKQRPEINSGQIGLIGYSQGGYIAQMVAAEHTGDISLLINLVGPAQNVYDQVMFDMHNQYACRGFKGSKLEFKTATFKMFLSMVKFTSQFIKPVFLSHVIRHDPARYIPRIHCPMLTIYAENDYMVDDIENTKLMTKLSANKSDRHSIHTIEGVNHFFLKSDLCYNLDKIDKTVHPELFKLINNWLIEKDL